MLNISQPPFMTWTYYYYTVVPKGLLGWVRHLPAVLVRFLAFLVFLSLPCLTAIRSRLWLHLEFAACSL